MLKSVYTVSILEINPMNAGLFSFEKFSLFAESSFTAFLLHEGGILIFGGLSALIPFYLFVIYRNRRINYLIPKRKRQPVPWTILDVLLIAGLFFCLPVLLFFFIRLPEELVQAIVNIDPAMTEQLAKAHPISELMARAAHSNYSFFILSLAFSGGVLGAPLAEEFLFRIVFQGALEREIPDEKVTEYSVDNSQDILQELPDGNQAVQLKNSTENTCFMSGCDVNNNVNNTNNDANKQSSLSIDVTAEKTFEDNSIKESSPKNKNVQILDPRSFQDKSATWLAKIVVVVLPAFFFAIIHARDPNEVRDPEMLLKTFCIIPIAYFLTILFGVLWLKTVRKASWADLGLPAFSKKAKRKEYSLDFFRGFLLYLLSAPILFGVLAILNAIRPNAVNDPGAIFILAVILGFVYLRSHSWILVFALHFSLNLFSFLQILFFT